MSTVVVDLIEPWLATLPPKTRKSAKSDLKEALSWIHRDNIQDVLEYARSNPTELLDELDNGLRIRQYQGTTRNKIKSILRRWLRFHGIETITPH